MELKRRVSLIFCTFPFFFFLVYYYAPSFSLHKCMYLCIRSPMIEGPTKEEKLIGRLRMFVQAKIFHKINIS